MAPQRAGPGAAGRPRQGEIGLTHEAFDTFPPSRTVEYVRELLVTQGLLPTRDRDLARMERWVADKLAMIDHPDDRQTIRAFVHWYHLRAKEATGELGRGAVRNAKQQTTVAILFLAWLRERDVALDAFGQGDLDEWLATSSLLLLYAQPVSRITQLKIDDITVDGADVAIRFGKDLVPLPAPLGAVLLVLLERRPNMATAANPNSAWLFPGSMRGPGP
jgi:integrase